MMILNHVTNTGLFDLNQRDLNSYLVDPPNLWALQIQFQPNVDGKYFKNGMYGIFVDCFHPCHYSLNNTV